MPARACDRSAERDRTQGSGVKSLAFSPVSGGNRGVMSDGKEPKEPADARGRPEPAANEQEKRDPFGPPEVPCECFCLHCRRTFMSDQIWFQRVNGARDDFAGFWK